MAPRKETANSIVDGDTFKTKSRTKIGGYIS